MATAAKLGGGKTTKLAGVGAGGPVDLGQYATTYGSQVTDAAFKQPFWDLENYDSEGNLLGITGDLFSSNPWDVVKVNGTPLPGIWTATATPSLQLDVQKPNGYDGAALVQKGYVPAGITITGQIWTPDQWAHFQELIPTFWRAPNKWAINDVKKQAAQIVGAQLSVSIDYPGLAPLGIGSMVIYQMGPPEDTDQKGVKQIRMMARQYIAVPQKRNSAVKKTNGAGKDRTAQASAIGMAGQIASIPKLQVPESKTSPVPPSIGQARLKLPDLPAYARH